MARLRIPMHDGTYSQARRVIFEPSGPNKHLRMTWALLPLDGQDKWISTLEAIELLDRFVRVDYVGGWTSIFETLEVHPYLGLLQKLSEVIYPNGATRRARSRGPATTRAEWPVDSPRPSFPITSIVSQSPREFLCAANDARKPFRRLRVPPFSLSAASLALEPTMESALPTQPQVFCFRDDNVPFAQESHVGHQLWRHRFAAAIDSDAYCYFIDLERQRKIHTMQLLLPFPQTTAIAKMQWVGTSEWQALVATLSDHTIAVFSLPTQFAFSPTSKTRVAAVDWAQLKRTGRLSRIAVLSFDGQIPEQVLTDPLGDVGFVATRDGAVFTVNFHSGLRRLLRAAPTLELTAGDMRSAYPLWALSCALLITRSADRSTLQCWEPGLGRELTRLHVANALCTCFRASPFDVHLVAAGYQDGSLRVFDVNEQQLVTQWCCHCSLSGEGLNRPERGDPRVPTV